MSATMKSIFCRAIVVLSIITFALSATPADAVDFQWNVTGPADWNVGTNWTPEGPPSGGGGNHGFVNNGGTAVISADIPDIQDIFVGMGAGTSGTLNQTGGNTFAGTGSWTFIGRNGGTGTYNLSGGVQNKARLYVGLDNGATGTLNMTGTGRHTGEELNVGVGGNGSTGTANFSDDATVTVTGLFQIANGTANVTGNALIQSDNEVWVGQAGGNSATLNQNSGTIEADTWIAIGRDSGTGVVNLSGTATMRKINNGTDNSDGSFIVLGGLGTGGSGTLNISENAVVHSDTGMILNETAGQAGIVNQNGGTVTLNDFTPQDFQPTYGASLNLDPNGHGLGVYNLSNGSLNAETVVVGGGEFNMNGHATFSATNFMGDLIQGGGTVSPGASPGTMTVTGNYSLNSGDLFIELDGLAAGTEHDQLIVTGDVSLAGDLTLDLGFTPSLGDMFTIIDNQGANPVSGMFTAGSSIDAGGFLFGINYAGGDGNDVVLTVVPEPSTALLSLAMMGLITIAVKRHQRNYAA
jgi:hypothetical protein